MSNNRIGLPQVNLHNYCWGEMFNDFMSRFLHYDNYDLIVNSSNPPSISINSEILLYSSYSTSISSSIVTANTLYPVNTTIYYSGAFYIRESIQVNSTWLSSAINLGNFPTQSSESYFLYCYGQNEVYANRYKGLYGAIPTSNISISYYESQGGVYGNIIIDSTNQQVKIIGGFTSTNSTIKNTYKIASMGSKERGYISNLEMYSTGQNITIRKFGCDLNNVYIEYKQDVVLDLSSTIENNKWYGIVLKETSNIGEIIYVTTGLSWQTWTLSTQGSLGTSNIYDGCKNYCRDYSSNNIYYRFIGLVKASSGSSIIDTIIPLKNYPNIKTGISILTTNFTIPDILGNKNIYFLNNTTGSNIALPNPQNNIGKTIELVNINTSTIGTSIQEGIFLTGQFNDNTTSKFFQCKNRINTFYALSSAWVNKKLFFADIEGSATMNMGTISPSTSIKLAYVQLETENRNNYIVPSLRCMNVQDSNKEILMTWSAINIGTVGSSVGKYTESSSECKWQFILENTDTSVTVNYRLTIFEYKIGGLDVIDY
jgi:hypothetical protein